MSTTASHADFLRDCEVEALASLPLIAGQWSDRTLPSVGDFNQVLVFEDVLQGRAVFVNGLSGGTCSPGAYMTVIDFKALEAALDAFGRDRMRFHDWRRLVSYYRHNWSISPTFGILAAMVARFIGLPDPLSKEEAIVSFYHAGADECPVMPGPAIAA